MTTLTINDKEVETIISMYGRDAIINYIKTFKPVPKSRPKQEDDFDSRIRALKPVNTQWAERLKKAFESNYIYFSEKFTEIDYLKIEENVILFLPSILSHSIELKLMTKEEISKYLELDFTD